jgi:two-component system chemotaxis sensor kinase CheA
MIDTSEYMEIFLSESREHLDILNKALLELEKNPEDRDRINEIFRSAHTLKGMAATMGFMDISELSHRMENVLDLIRNEELKISGEIIDTLFEALDFLEAMLEGLSKGGEAVGAGQVLEKLDAILGKEAEQTGAKTPDESLSDQEQDTIEQMIAEGLTPYRIDVRLSQDTALKSVRAFMVFKNLEGLGEIFKTIPDAEAIEDEKFDQEFTVFLATKESEEKVAAIGALVKGTTNVEEVGIQRLVLEKGAKKKPKKGEAGEGGLKERVPVQPKREVVKSIQSVRVSIDRLDTLMNLVGELVITKGRLNQIGDAVQNDALTETVDGIDRLTTDLQDIVMQMRMVEVGRVFDRFPRMVRDLAKKRGKMIAIEIEGREIELDRTVLDEIGDPLVHLLRNAVDHGIEFPEERKKAGKPEEGTVRLVAMRGKSHIEIMVEDDGKGIDPATMRETAIKKGLLTEDEASKLDDIDALRLVFMPGFSTAAEVTDVSGRGVGMDVVHNRIISLGGTADLTSEVGKGTIFTLKLPLTLAIIQALLVGLGDETYAIPINSVKETLAISQKDVKTVTGQETYVLRGHVLPLVRLDKLLNLPEKERGDTLAVVVVERAGKSVGIIVDELMGQQEIVIKSLGDFLKGIRGFAGATIMGDGRVILILDIATLM